MPTYKLTYFTARARAEPIRYLFAAAGVEFEDVRVAFEDWPKLKPKMPFRQMPVLEVGGKQLSEAQAIIRYLGNEFGLAGKNKWEVAEADQFSEAVEDIFLLCSKMFFDKDEAHKAEALKKFKEEQAPNALQAFEATLAKNSSGYLVGSGLTYADLRFLNVLEMMDGVLRDDSKAFMSAYPNIQKHRQKIQSLPKIAAWVKKRPESKF